MAGLLSLLLGCPHRHTSLPVTLRQKASAAGGKRYVSDTYIVCLDCGKEFPYSWEEMRVVKGRRRTLSESTEATRVTRWPWRHRPAA